MKPLLASFLFASAAVASSTTAWEMNGYQDFIRGRFQGVSLSREGRLTLAPKMDTLFSSDQPVVWSVAQGRDGEIYAGTGNRGRLFRVDKSGKSSLLWTADEPEIFALAVDANGILYAGTSPNGKIYRIENGKASVYFAPRARYIWALVFASDGALYAGTGDEGKIFRIDGPGKGDVYYATGQSHVSGLSLDRQGRLLAGTEPNGLLYRVTAKNKAFVLYDANLPEIRAVSTAPDGAIYAVALGGSVARRVQNAAQAVQTAGVSTVSTSATTTITVNAADNTQAGPDIKPPTQPQQTESARQTQTSTTPQAAAQYSPVVDVSGVEKSAVYRINPDNSVETLWSSKDENVYDLLALPGQILFSTDGNGRIYRLSPDRRLTLVTQTNEAEATRLLAAQGTVLAATANMGRIYRLDEASASSGMYESPVHDAGAVAQWGRLSWHADAASRSAVAFRTRSGNSIRPDQTWSEWSEPLANPDGSKITSPSARYLQWKAEFSSAGGVTPAVDSVSAAYLPQNSPPVLKSINVTAQAATGQGHTAQQSTSAVYTVTVTDTGDSGTSVSGGTPTQTLSRSAPQQINVSWQAEDADGDRLVYSLYFRGEGEKSWKPLRLNVHENSMTLDGDALADGRYYFRVTASDREFNPPAMARDAELISSPVLIDNTPPVITLSEPRRASSGVEISFTAFDAASPLRRCEYSVDAGNWTPLEAVDGVIDSQKEDFHLRIEHLQPGEHLLVIRAVDSANNAGLAKAVLR